MCKFNFFFPGEVCTIPIRPNIEYSSYNRIYYSMFISFALHCVHNELRFLSKGNVSCYFSHFPITRT